MLLLQTEALRVFVRSLFAPGIVINRSPFTLYRAFREIYTLRWHTLTYEEIDITISLQQSTSEVPIQTIERVSL